MKHKILPALLMAALAVSSYKVFDRQGKLVEIWEDRGDTITIYSSTYERLGYIEKEASRWSRYDREMNRIAIIEKGDKGEITLDRIEK